MRPILVVLRFPAFELSNQFLPVLEAFSSVEFLRIRFVAPLHLAVGFRACQWNVLVGDAQARKMPRELRTEGRIVVCLDLPPAGSRCSSTWPPCPGPSAPAVLLDHSSIRVSGSSAFPRENSPWDFQGRPAEANLSYLSAENSSHCPRFQQRSDYGEVFVRGPSLLSRLHYHLSQEVLGYLGLQQPVAVLGEHRCG